MRHTSRKFIQTKVFQGSRFKDHSTTQGCTRKAVVPSFYTQKKQTKNLFIEDY